MLWPNETDCCRCWAPDRRRGGGAWQGAPEAVNRSVDLLGQAVLSLTEEALAGSDEQRAREWLGQAPFETPICFAYVKSLLKSVGNEGRSPQLVGGSEKDGADEASHVDESGRFLARENGVKFLLSMREGYSVGLFLDQRDNRRRLVRGSVFGGEGDLFSAVPSGRQPEVLNLFSYTCAFSVAAALGPRRPRTLSVDLSKKYLDWGRENFRANGIDPDDRDQHDFIYGDCFEWLGYLARKERQFDLVCVDPPTFSRSRNKKRKTTTFSVKKDYGRLAGDALKVLRPGGVLLCSTNCATLPPGAFERDVEAAVRAAGRRVVAKLYSPQPPDFSAGGQKMYLKTLWLQID